jgi:hypothetical protein
VENFVDMEALMKHSFRRVAASLLVAACLAGLAAAQVPSKPATQAAPQDKPVDMKKLLAEIVGEYSFELQGQVLVVEFTEADGKLFGAPPGQAPEEIMPVEGKPLGFDVTVSTNGEYYELQFVRNDKGVIDKCVMTVQGMVIEGTKVIK